MRARLGFIATLAFAAAFGSFDRSLASAEQEGAPLARISVPVVSEPPWCVFVPPAPRGQSLGFPWHGRLREGVFLADGATVRHVEAGASEAHYFGSRALVQMVRTAAERVSAMVPGARLSVGELSARDGGDLHGHRSHENGRDVDLGFFVVDATGRSVELPAFAKIDWGGRIEVDGRRYHFDAARNWLLVKALLESDVAIVQHVFTHERVRVFLLDEAVRQGASPELLRRASRVLHQPHGHVTAHLNHMHVRIYCTPDDGPRCRDVRPYWPWAGPFDEPEG